MTSLAWLFPAKTRAEVFPSFEKLQTREQNGKKKKNTELPKLKVFLPPRFFFQLTLMTHEQQLWICTTNQWSFSAIILVCHPQRKIEQATSWLMLLLLHGSSTRLDLTWAITYTEKMCQSNSYIKILNFFPNNEFHFSPGAPQRHVHLPSLFLVSLSKQLC